MIDKIKLLLRLIMHIRVITIVHIRVIMQL